ncbi:hypothetical protein TcCL_NonESM09579 [Trypanosoma cruzi]|nr:hypothetical protein TcCL_NonESM09579 [Trypanosoma cruzi]
MNWGFAYKLLCILAVVLLMQSPGVTDGACGRQNLVHGGMKRRGADCLVVSDESCLTAWRGLSFAGATCFVCPDTACAEWRGAILVCLRHRQAGRQSVTFTDCVPVSR